MVESIKDTLEESAIIRQVEKICNSGEFKSKRLLCEFIGYIVSEYLAGRGEMIKGYTIGIEVFGKDEDFDPGEDALVRIHAGRLRRALELYYLKSGREDPVRIEIPKGGYVPVISASGSSLPKVQNDPSLAHEAKPGLRPTVAILPFRNLTGDSSEDYFAQGFTEELSMELSKYEDLIVYHCSAGLLREDDQSVPGGLLYNKGVRFAIEGSLVKNSDQLKMLVRLTDTRDDKLIWAERYVRELTADGLNEIQEHIAREVSSILANEFGIILENLSLEAHRIKAGDMDTFGAVLKYYYFLANQSQESAIRSFNALQVALKKNPDSGKVKALLASHYGNRYMLDYPNAEESLPEMSELAEEAAILDPNDSIIQVSLIFKCFVFNEKARFFKLVDKYLSLIRNNSTRMGSVAFYLSLYGEWERGKMLLDRVFQSGIRYPLYFHGATTLYFFRQQRYEEALSEASRYKVPSLFWGPMLRTAVMGKLNKPEEAREDIAHLKQLKPDFNAKARYLISLFAKEGALVEQVMEGLRQAGMELD